MIFNSGNCNVYSFPNKGPQPDVWNITYPISGTLLIGQGRNYGPYTSAIYAYISVNWAPTDQTLSVILMNLDTNIRYSIIVSNPALSGNSKNINYIGTITISYQ